MREFFNNIDHLPEGIQKLRGERHVFVYGVGEYAAKVLQTLERFHIEIEGIVTSAEYYSGNNFCGQKVYVYEQKIMEVDHIVLIAAFNILWHKDLTSKLIKEDKVKRIYVTDGNSRYMYNYNYLCGSSGFIDPKFYLIDDFYDGITVDRKWNYNFYIENKKRFDETYEWLEDDRSKLTMEKCLEGWLELSNFSLMELWKREDFDNQYFPDIVKLCWGGVETIIDCGAYTGDTLLKFDEKIKENYRYYALEPDVRRFEALDSAISKCHGKIFHIPVAAWKTREKLFFSTEHNCGEIVDIYENQRKEKANGIEADAIDHIVPQDEKVTYIKMDIEGAELEALRGAAKTIRRCKPKLAICVYHRREDLITIPQFIKSISSGYKLYLRGHLYCPSEVVLYAIHD